MDRYYVLEPGTYVRKSGENLLIMKGDQVRATVPLAGLDQLILVGTSISGAVLNELVRRRVETVLLSPWGRFRGRITVDEHKHVARRKAQYLRLSDPAEAARIAGRLVAAKLRNGARFLQRRGTQYGDRDLHQAAAHLQGLADLAQAEEDLELIRGIEGRGANRYFAVFERLIRVPGFEFHGRSRRPPLDAVNALLSFVYTLLTNEVLTAVKIVGLDPHLGALHAVEYGRPSLACDLVEEWRTYLGDRLVLTLLNRRVIRPDDFVYRRVDAPDGVDEVQLRAQRPVEMKPRIARALIDAYERWMQTPVRCPFQGTSTSHRGIIRDQARRFLRYLMEEEPEYRPFPWSRIG